MVGTIRYDVSYSRTMTRKRLAREEDVSTGPRHLDGVSSLEYASLLASYREHTP